MNILIKDAGRYYHEHFGEPAFIVRSPGRINLIGEHTDYNDGFVLPAAVDNAAFISIGERTDNQIHLFSVDYQEYYTGSTEAITQSPQQWPNYILGIVDVLQKSGYKCKGFNAVLIGDVPIGAGMSSSAAVECATIFALNELFGFKLPRMAMVKLAQRAENEFVGVRCGMMDQFASMFGKKGNAIELDCRSNEFAYYPLKSDEYDLLLVNTRVKHSLAESNEYNTRRQNCETGVTKVQQFFPEVRSLRDVTPEMLSKTINTLEDEVYKQCLYVVEEIIRVQEACEDLRQEDIEAFGKKMFATHKGLSTLYKVSCTELDFLVQFAAGYKDVIGSRMMGGGFGGCTINLIKKSGMAGFVDSVSEAYLEHFKVLPDIFPVRTADGTIMIV